MKKLIAVLILTVVLTMTSSLSVFAGEPSEEFIKKAGGGWSTEWYTGNKITFSISVQTLEPTPAEPGKLLAKGNFQLIDHAEKTRIHGTIDYFLYDPSYPELSAWIGECSVNRTDGYSFDLLVHDEDEPGYPGDWAWIIIRGSNFYREFILELEKGNIKAH